MEGAGTTGCTPILDALIAHAQSARASLHVPGHHSGRVLPEALAQWLGPAAKLDLTELPGLDNLANPNGCIAASQRLAAAFYGSDTCLFSVGGSTLGILSAVAGVVRPGRDILFLNPFHQSAWNAMVLSDAGAKLAPVSLDAASSLAVPPSAEQVASVLNATDLSTVDAVFLTSPTYQGRIADVEGIAHYVHAAGLPLIVDEAHGAHLGLAEGLGRHSIACGADVVIHSVHKMLPGLTQTGWVHIQGARVDADAIARAMHTLQTTSPSYLLLASLDAAQAWLHTSGSQAAQRTLQHMADLGWTQKAGQDPLKLWIPTGTMAASDALAGELAAEGLAVEYADPSGVLCILGFDPPRWLLERLLPLAIRRLDEAAQASVYTRPETPELVCRPGTVHRARHAWVTLAEAVGRVAAGMVTPYPPGVPLVLPGQRISESLIATLEQWWRTGYEVHGLQNDGRILVADL